MEVSVCPSCGCAIGGRNHVAVNGVRRLGDDASEAKPGYLNDALAGLEGKPLTERYGSLHTGE